MAEPVPELAMICPRCGEWIDRPLALEPSGPSTLRMTCPHCRAPSPVEQHRLWFVTGSSGSGKTILTPLLRPRLPECVVFECEAIHYWLFKDERGYASLYNQWLQVAREIALNGRPTVLVGTALPEQLDECPNRPYFSAVHYLGLVCEAAEQTRRLRARPPWRRSAEPTFVAQSVAFTERLRELAATGRVELLDTTGIAPSEAADRAASWVRRRLRAGRGARRSA
jgi:hypothetical protein